MRINRTQLEHSNTGHDRKGGNDGGGSAAKVEPVAVRRSTTTTGDRIGRRKMRIASIKRHYSPSVVVKDEKANMDSTLELEKVHPQMCAAAIVVKVESESEIEEKVVMSGTDLPIGSTPTTAERVDRLLTGASVLAGRHGQHTTVKTMGGQSPSNQPRSRISRWSDSTSVVLSDCGSCGSSAMSLSSDDETAPVPVVVNSGSIKREGFDSKPDLIFINCGYDAKAAVSYPDYQHTLLLDATANMVNQQVRVEKVESSDEQILYEASQSSYSPFIPKEADDEVRKLFIGGLSFDTSECDLEKYFSRFGTVDGVNLKYDSETGISRGFAFISFAEEEATDEVLKQPVHIIHGRWVEPRRAKSRPVFKKIFVGGLDGSITGDDIRDYFSRFGKVNLVDIPIDRMSQLRRHFCFVIFQTEEAAEEAAMWPRQMIKNRLVDVRRTVPSNVLAHQKRMAQAAGLDLSEYDCNYKIDKMNATARMVTASAAMAAAALATPIASYVPQSVSGLPVSTCPQMSITPNGALIPFTDHITSASMAALAVGTQPNAYPAATNFSANCYAVNNYSYSGQPYTPIAPATYMAAQAIPFASPYMSPYQPMYPAMMHPQAYMPISPYSAVPSPASVPSPTVPTPSSDPHASALCAYYGYQGSTSTNFAAPDYSHYYANSNYTNPATNYTSLGQPPPPPPEDSEPSAISGSSVIPNTATAVAAAAATTTTITVAARPYADGRA